MVQERTGLSTYNIKLIMTMGSKELVDIGILYDGGTRCVMKGLIFSRDLILQTVSSGYAGISGLEKITEEQLEVILNNFDPIGKIYFCCINYF